MLGTIWTLSICNGKIIQIAVRWFVPGEAKNDKVSTEKCITRANN